MYERAAERAIAESKQMLSTAFPIGGALGWDLAEFISGESVTSEPIDRFEKSKDVLSEAAMAGTFFLGPEGRIAEELGGTAKTLEEGAILEPYALESEAMQEGALIEPPKRPTIPSEELEAGRLNEMDKFSRELKETGLDPHITAKKPIARPEYRGGVIESQEALEADRLKLSERLAIPEERLKLKRIEGTPAGHAQSNAVGGVELEPMIQRENGEWFNVDGLEFPDKDSVLFVEHKEILGPWESSVYFSSEEGLSEEIFERLLRNQTIAQEFEKHGCVGWLYTTNEERLARVLADRLNSDAVFRLGRWEVLQKVH